MSRSDRGPKSSISEPSEQALANRIKLLLLQYAQFADCPNDGIDGDILHQDDTGFEERDRNRNLEFRPAQTGGVRNDRDQRPIKVP
jgi:hypothetical protein